MAEELKSLIDKINEEGVKAADKKAKAIEDEARGRADAIIKKAQAEAERAIEEAEERIAKMEESSRSNLQQAGRDLILNLRKEINDILDSLIRSHVHKALDAEELAEIIRSLVKDHAGKDKDEIVISLKKEDLEKLERGFLSALKDEIKKGITLKSSDEIRGGFTISYDHGRSYYDFTDKALAEQIAFRLRPKLAEILRETVA